VYLGLIKFHLDREAFPEDEAMIASILRKLCRQLRKDFSVLARSDQESLALLVCLLHPRGGDISDIIEKMSEYLEKAGSGRVDSSVQLIEPVDRLLE